MHYQGLQKVFQSLLTTTEEDLQQQSFEFKAGTIRSKNLEEKDRQRQLLYYETLIRGCNKAVYQLVYKAKKFVFLKGPLYLINQ